MIRRIRAPLCREEIDSLRAGDSVLLSGVIYTGRDAAHKRMCAMIGRGEVLPIDICGQVIYYAGPCPAKPGDTIGACGPTTSSRMDDYAPALCGLGLKGMIGKGPRNDAVKASVIENGCVYFAATGGAGALIASCVKSARVVAFEDLGTEAIRELYVEDMPLIVAMDPFGGDLYTEGPARYRL